METKVRFSVDAEHCRRATEDLYEILRTQERAFLDRWHQARSSRAVVAVARWMGLVASVLGLFLVGALLYFDTRDWATQPSFWFIPLFVASIALFVFLPRIAVGVRAWSVGRADRRARRQANRYLRQAEKLVPFEAEFDFRGDLLIYTRAKVGGVWQLAWSRMLSKYRQRGLAIQAQNITAIFRRSTSLQPSMLILHRDRDWTGSILQDAGVALARFPLPDQRNP